MSSKLRDLIRAVRACKTSAEERSVIHIESARIRKAFASGQSRGRCMLKLMYLNMLGYPTEFGQMEVVKLIAEEDYAAKRVGYLAVAMLLDEKAEVLTLAENHIKRDLNNTQHPFVQALALDCIANISGLDMARDMMDDVDQMLAGSVSNSHLKKKAALAARRIARKVPNSSGVFLDRMDNFTAERNHGVLVSFFCLANECLERDPERAEGFRSAIPAVVHLLRGLVLSSFAQDHDVNGVADPFLQVECIRFLRITGAGDPSSVEGMNDVLAQVMTNTDAAKSVGMAVLYEAVRTVIAIPADESLKTLAFNVLSRFLSNKDNNARFVALDTLQALVAKDPAVGQHHKLTVIECLKDADVSIRRRAVHLTVALIDRDSVRLMVPDLLAYLAVCSDELKKETAQLLCKTVERLAPTDEWRHEMSFRLMRLGGADITVDFGLRFLNSVGRASAAEQRRVTEEAWQEFAGRLSLESATHTHTALLLGSVWVLGEFSDYLPAGAASDTVTFLSNLINDSPTAAVRQYALTAVAKIAAARAPGGAACNGPPDDSTILAQSVLESAAGSMDCEVQQRACEYLMMLGEFPELATFALSRMPALDETLDDGADGEMVRLPSPTAIDISEDTARAEPPKSNLDDLFGGPVTMQGGATASVAPPAPAGLESLFGGPAPAAPAAPAVPAAVSALDPFAPAPAPAAAPPAQPKPQSVDDLFGGVASPQPPQPPRAPTSAALDPFAAPAPTAPAPSAPAADPMQDLFGAAPAPAAAAPTAGDPFAAMANMAPPAPAPAAPAAASPAAASPAAASPAAASPTMDIFGGTPAAPSPAAPSPAPATTSPAPAAAPDAVFQDFASPAPQTKTYDVFRNQAVVVEAEVGPSTQPGHAAVPITATVRSLGQPLSGISLQVAVARNAVLDIKPASHTALAGGQAMTQSMVVDSSKDGMPNVMLRFRLAYAAGGPEEAHVFQISHPKA